MAGGVVVIGAGHAGGVAVDALRTEGYQGPITLVGDEASLPYQRPPLSKGYLLEEVSRDQLFLRPADFYSVKDIGLIDNNRAVAIDRAAQTVRLGDGASLPYDHLVLATGARPRLLDVAGADLAGIHVLRTLADVDAIRTDMEDADTCAVVGGGFIGLEIAAVLTKLGKSVAIVEAADRLMGRAVSVEVSDYFLNLHRSRGAVVHLSAGVTGFHGRDGRVSQVDTSTGPIDADLVIVGIGVIPNDQLASEAGLTVERGIRVDTSGRTDDPAIFAIGDCCVLDHALYPDPIRLESVQNAVDQAKLIAAAISGKEPTYSAIPWFWSDQFDVKLQIAGLSRPGQETLAYHDAESGTLAVYHFDQDRLAAAETVNRARDHMSARRLIGSDTPPGRAEVEAAGGDLKPLLKR